MTDVRIFSAKTPENLEKVVNVALQQDNLVSVGAYVIDPIAMKYSLVVIFNGKKPAVSDDSLSPEQREDIERENLIACIKYNGLAVTADQYGYRDNSNNLFVDYRLTRAEVLEKLGLAPDAQDQDLAGKFQLPLSELPPIKFFEIADREQSLLVLGINI